MAATTSMLVQGVLVFCLPSRVDVSNTRDLVQPVRQAIQEGQRKIALDFTGTQSVDSTALGALVQVFKMLRSEGGDLMLCCVSDAVHRVFSITRLDQVFTLCSSREDAIARLSKS